MRGKAMGTTQEIRPQAGPQEAFLSSAADIAVYGGQAGGGKTWALLLEPLRHIDNGEFGAVIFRRISTMITDEGGIWDESSKLYPLLGATGITSPRHRWRFSSGATITFRHLQHEKDVLDLQGAQIPLIGFDELTHFTRRQFFYMLSRNRSLCGVRPYIRATTNPDADSWVREFIDWWIDPKSGLPILERSGVLRWFYVGDDDKLLWFDSKEEAYAARPDLASIAEPTSVTFVPATLDDNPALLKADPGYRARLLSLPRIDRERLLGGNWNIRPDAGEVFKRTDFRRITYTPEIAEALEKSIMCRYWDKAATQDGGDWTVGANLVKLPEGMEIAMLIENVVRGQWSTFKRDEKIKRTAERDRERFPRNEPQIWLEEEGGSSGKDIGAYNTRQLMGFDVRTDSPKGDKVYRAGPLSAAVERGDVGVLVYPPDHPRAWDVDAYLAEMERFPDSRSHDDQVDASTGAYNKLAKRGTSTNVYSLSG